MLIVFEVLKTYKVFQAIAFRTAGVPVNNGAETAPRDNDLDSTAKSLSELALTLKGARKLELIGAGLAVIGAACDVTASLLAVWVH
jgi:hypothetical protein